MVEVRTSRELANLHADGVDVALRVGLGTLAEPALELLFEEYVFPGLPRHGVPGPPPRPRSAPTTASAADHDPRGRQPVSSLVRRCGTECADPAARPGVRANSALCVEAASAGLGIRAGAPAARAGGARGRPAGADLQRPCEGPVLLLPGLARRQPADRRHPPLLRLGARRVRPCGAAEGGRLSVGQRAARPAAIASLNAATAARGPSGCVQTCKPGRGDEVEAGGDQRAAVGRRDPADGDAGRQHALVPDLQDLGIGAGLGFLGRGGEEGAERHILGASLGRRQGGVPAVVAGDADDAVRPDDAPRLGVGASSWPMWTPSHPRSGRRGRAGR